jgi:hypothetical protein
VSLKDIRFFYMEESGDLRSSSVCEEMRQALQRAVFHLEDFSRHPAMRVQFNFTLMSGSNDLVELTQ